MAISKKGALLLLGIGALAAYKYNKMSSEDRAALKDKAKKFFDDNVSPFLKNAFGMAGDAAVEQSAPLK